jgi:hypothetical protein
MKVRELTKKIGEGFPGRIALPIPRISRNVPIYYLMNIVAALPAALRYSPLLAAERR